MEKLKPVLLSHRWVIFTFNYELEVIMHMIILKTINDLLVSGDLVQPRVEQVPPSHTSV